MNNERKIGSTFKTSKGIFQVVENESCDGCFLNKPTNDPLNKCGQTAISRQITGPCSRLRRKDCKKVIFKKSELSHLVLQALNL